MENEIIKALNKERYFIKDKFDGLQHCFSGDEQFYLISANEQLEQFILTKLKQRDKEWKTKLDYIDAQFSHINSFEHSETMPILREYRDMIEELYKKLNLIK